MQLGVPTTFFSGAVSPRCSIVLEYAGIFHLHLAHVWGVGNDSTEHLSQDEAKKESDQYDKFECYCKKTIAELEDNIRQAETNPISQADIDKKQSEQPGRRCVSVDGGWVAWPSSCC